MKDEANGNMNDKSRRRSSGWLTLADRYANLLVDHAELVTVYEKLRIKAMNRKKCLRSLNRHYAERQHIIHGLLDQLTKPQKRASDLVTVTGWTEEDLQRVRDNPVNLTDIHAQALKENGATPSLDEILTEMEAVTEHASHQIPCATTSDTLAQMEAPVGTDTSVPRKVRSDKGGKHNWRSRLKVVCKASGRSVRRDKGKKRKKRTRVLNVRVTPEGFMTSNNAAKYLGYAEKTMSAKRADDSGPVYLKTDTGRILYSRVILDGWAKLYADNHSNSKLAQEMETV